jgi:cysteine desulfurase
LQAFGKLEISIGDLGADSLGVSSHKVHGPQGAGALVTRGEIALKPLVFGGGQEHGLRSGTENVAAIVGFGRAAELAAQEADAASAHFENLRSVCMKGLARVPGARVVEPRSSRDDAPSRVAAIVAGILPGAPSEVRMHHLEELGVVVSAGSACHAHRREASPTLLAMGISAEEARTMLRISFSRLNTEDEVGRAMEALAEICTKPESTRR